ncbi:MAG TPA: LysM peptidoglycan-binding domain-containing M23 family metallopeptidase [Thermomicrobiaceae bacterium]|nr:LysM peptidoglycan-binding domain-containing M23 family metallopeptidase [Thermomicrobiaceae bacterium]
MERRFGERRERAMPDSAAAPVSSEPRFGWRRNLDPIASDHVAQTTPQPADPTPVRPRVIPATRGPRRPNLPSQPQFGWQPDRRAIGPRPIARDQSALDEWLAAQDYWMPKELPAGWQPPSRLAGHGRALAQSVAVATTVAAVATSGILGTGVAAAAPAPVSASDTGSHQVITAAPQSSSSYTVVTGDNVHRIAARFGVTTQAIVDANNLANPNLILPGQRLNIPPATSTVTVTVKAGDTVNNLAAQYGVSSASIVSANQLANSNLILVGQKLSIPGARAQFASVQPAAAPAGITVTVKAGDTIGNLASQYGVSSASIVSANKLGNANLILVGQKLLIPGGKAQDGAGGGTAQFASTASTPPVQKKTVTPAPAPAPAPKPPAPAAVTSQFIWPVHGTITQGFGPTSFTAEPAYEGYAHFHQGLDIANSMYTPIVAAGSGTVTFAGWNNYGYGYCVMIDHGNGLVTLYGHMAQQPSVSVGQHVSQGQHIGVMGSTGNSTGPHTHFGVMKNGVWVNPMNYLP